MREPLPVRQQPFAGQELFDLPDLTLAGIGPEVEAPARRRDRLQHLQGAGPQALPFALALGACLFFALPTLPASRRHGLVRLSAPSPGTAASQVGLACGTAVLTALAANLDGALVAKPHLRPSDV